LVAAIEKPEEVANPDKKDKEATKDEDENDRPEIK